LQNSLERQKATGIMHKLVQDEEFQASFERKLLILRKAAKQQ